jgi:RHS repeat-associated protein
VLASFSNVASSATIKSNQVFGPYGNPRDMQGSSNTAKGFTGQYNDSLTGLDYYNSRYYDQVAGVFLSADVKQGNLQGINPYAYVGGNPETRNDPTGQYFVPGGGGNGGPPPSCTQLGDCSNISGSNPFLAYNFPPIVFPGSSSVPPSSLVVPQPKVNLGAPTSVPLSDGHTSCGTPDGSQPLCGNVGANFAVYLSTGGMLGVPGPWCIECGSGGGSNNGEGGGGSDLSSAYSSDTGGALSGGTNGGLDASLEEGREAWGMTPRSLNPDDLQTFAKLFINGDEYWGVNGEKPISFPVNAISHSHAEIDALDQLVRDREITGNSGGDAVMLVDRMPCKSCYRQGGIGSGVRAARLNSLVIYYSASLDENGNLIPPGVFEVLGELQSTNGGT